MVANDESGSSKVGVGSAKVLLGIAVTVRSAPSVSTRTAPTVKGGEGGSGLVRAETSSDVAVVVS